MGTKLDFPGGGYVIVNDPDEVPGMIQTIHKFNQNSLQFHRQLMGMDVKAYRMAGLIERSVLSLSLTMNMSMAGIGDVKALTKVIKYFWAIRQMAVSSL